MRVSEREHPGRGAVVSFMPHMQVLAKDVKYEAVYPVGRRVTLLSVPRYNFYWPTLYQLKQSLAIRQGTRIVDRASNG
jgi:hypothetical protein